MSTVTLSKPHWAMTSAENPDGMASQPLTAALPACHRSFSLFSAIARPFQAGGCRVNPDQKGYRRPASGGNRALARDRAAAQRAGTRVAPLHGMALRQRPGEQ